MHEHFSPAVSSTPHERPPARTPETEATQLELYRSREIITQPARLWSKVGLFGTCGSPASTWRTDIFIPALERRGVAYFNPQLGPDEWTPERAVLEAEELAHDAVLVLPVSKETHGYASLAEAGWAILSALLRGQRLGLFIEQAKTMPEEAQRARMLFHGLAASIWQSYPVFTVEDTMHDLAQWAAVVAREQTVLANSAIQEQRTITLPGPKDNIDMVALFGSTSPRGAWKQTLTSTFKAADVPYFDSYKRNWTTDDIAEENEHKLHDKVLLQVITGESDSFGSLAESGLLALSAFVRGQAYGLYIEDHPSSPRSDTNRARTLVREHINQLNAQFPGIVYLARSPQELAAFALHARAPIA